MMVYLLALADCLLWPSGMLIIIYCYLPLNFALYYVLGIWAISSFLKINESYLFQFIILILIGT